MSESIRTEQQRAMAELAALVEGLNDEVTRLDKQLTQETKKRKEVRDGLARVITRLQAMLNEL